MDLGDEVMAPDDFGKRAKIEGQRGQNQDGEQDRDRPVGGALDPIKSEQTDDRPWRSDLILGFGHPVNVDESRCRRSSHRSTR